MGVNRFDGRAIKYETEQHKRQHASKRAMPVCKLQIGFSGHCFTRYVRVLCRSIRMPTSTVKEVSGPLHTRKTETRLAILKLVLTAAFCVFPGLVAAQDVQPLKAKVTISSLSPARLRINAELPGLTTALSFRNAYAGVVGLGDRVENLEGKVGTGQTIAVRKLTSGEFQSSQSFLDVSYEVDLAGTIRPTDLSHVSSLDAERGLLMLADLLPASSNRGPFNSAEIDISMPDGWRASSNLKRVGEHFSTDDLETAVILVGSSVDQKKRNAISIISSGKWPFSDDDAIKIASRIRKEHSRTTKFEFKDDAVVMLVPYPGEAGPEKWGAETRGNTVVLVLGRNGSRKKVLGKLGIVLSHELFHLWVPNSLKLKGDYDWFFEGFTLYQALRTDLRLGLISFDDYLNTLAGVYDVYKTKADADKFSLLEASERRWTNSSSFVYEKGMLAAFVYDLAVRRLSNCNDSLEDVYPSLFDLGETGQANANETIIRLLNRRAGFESFGKDYVENPVNIRLDSTLEPYGIQITSSRLLIKPELNESQRKLLACIGYKK
jgi:hypothetical protein